MNYVAIAEFMLVGPGCNMLTFPQLQRQITAHLSKVGYRRSVNNLFDTMMKLGSPQGQLKIDQVVTPAMEVQRKLAICRSALLPTSMIACLAQ